MSNRTMWQLTTAAQKRVVDDLKQALASGDVDMYPDAVYRGLVDRMRLQGSSSPTAHTIQMVIEWLRDDESSQWHRLVASHVLEAQERELRALRTYRERVGDVIRASLSDSALGVYR